jgi:hypothetical protein
MPKAENASGTGGMGNSRKKRWPRDGGRAGIGIDGSDIRRFRQQLLLGRCCVPRLRSTEGQRLLDLGHQVLCADGFDGAVLGIPFAGLDPGNVLLPGIAPLHTNALDAKWMLDKSDRLFQQGLGRQAGETDRALPGEIQNPLTMKSARSAVFRIRRIMSSGLFRNLWNLRNRCIIIGFSVRLNAPLPERRMQPWNT